MAVNDITQSVNGLTSAGAHALRMENQQLKQQIQQVMAIVNVRGQHAVGAFIEGLQVTIAAARMGDAGAHEQLKMLKDLFDEMRLIGLIKRPGQ